MPIWQIKSFSAMHGGVLVSADLVEELISKGKKILIYFATQVYIIHHK